MRSLLIIAAICSLLSIDVSNSEAQDRCCRPTRQRLMFRMFQRVRPPQPVRYSPIVVPACPTPMPATDPGILMFAPSNIVVSAPLVEPVASSVVAPNPTPAIPTLAESTSAETSPAEPIQAEATPSVVAPTDQASPSDDATADTLKTKAEWRPLFDGKELGQWKKTKFGGEGAVDIEDGQISMDYGQYMTGLTHSGKDLPKNNYELELEAKRVDGGDFFCGLTFPVEKNHTSFVVGGWGGSVVGISSIDDMDASENPTTGYKVFKNDEWYKIRVRVTKGRLQAWINDSNFVDEEVTADRLSTRIEMERCHPLGICCFDTQAAFRNIRIREVSEPAEK